MNPPRIAINAPTALNAPRGSLRIANALGTSYGTEVPWRSSMARHRSQHPAERADQDHRHDVVTIRRRGSRGTHHVLAGGGEAERHVAGIEGDVPTEDDKHHGQRGCGAQDRVAEVAQPAVLGVGGAEPDLDRLGQAFATSPLAEVTLQELVGSSVAEDLRRQPGIDPRNRLGDIRRHLFRAVQLHDERLCGVEVVVRGLDEGAAPPVAQPAGHGVASRGRGPSLSPAGLVRRSSTAASAGLQSADRALVAFSRVSRMSALTYTSCAHRRLHCMSPGAVNGHMTIPTMLETG